MLTFHCCLELSLVWETEHIIVSYLGCGLEQAGLTITGDTCTGKEWLCSLFLKNYHKNVKTCGVHMHGKIRQCFCVCVVCV